MKNQTNRFAEFWKKQGLYWVLGACVLATAGGSALSIRNNMKEISEQNSAVIQSQKKSLSAAAAEKQVSDKAKPSESSATSAESSGSASVSTVTEKSTEPSNGSQTSGPLLYILPVTGKLGTAYSGDELIYFPTLKLWQVHRAQDVIAPAGTPVKAMADGEIIKIYEDPLWGVGVRMRHSDGMITTLYGLSSTLPVHEGNVLKLGDIIGTVARVPAEEEKAQIHIVFTNQKGETVDPMDYIRTAEKKS